MADHQPIDGIRRQRSPIASRNPQLHRLDGRGPSMRNVAIRAASRRRELDHATHWLIRHGDSHTGFKMMSLEATIQL